MSVINCIINGLKVKVPQGSSVYQAAKQALPYNHRIPTLCYHPYLTMNDPDDGCGICKVDVNGTLVNACCTDLEEGMVIKTGTPDVNENIVGVLKDLLSSHPLDCPTCHVNKACTFQDLLAQYDVSPKDLTDEEKGQYLDTHNVLFSEIEDYFGNYAVSLDASKCIVCKRCIRICEELQGFSILELGSNEEVNAFSMNLEDTECVSCGQCTFACPTGAIALNSQVADVARLLRNKEMGGDTVMVVQTAPAVRVTIAEDLGLTAGGISQLQLAAGLRALGFDHVFDTDFTADLTIMEEGFELIGRLTNEDSPGPFPMFTSCCPAWINMLETQFPQFIPNVSTCKSPQQMMGSLVKEYWAEKVGIDKENVFSVSIMPCTAKKDECQREQMKGDVDAVLTTRELAQLFKLKNIPVSSLEEELYDDPLGESTGAAVIFGATGGVMEAALRTGYEVVVGEEMPDINFVPARGLEGIKEATVMVGELPLKIAIAHQGANLRKFLEGVEDGTYADYHFVEFMMCKGGCIGGGGNPKIKVNESPLDDRIDAIYELDADEKYHPLRKSHENPSVAKLYEDFLGEPLSHKSHELLHTHYTDRKK